jgi:CRISPR-associated endonuclease Csn1
MRTSNRGQPFVLGLDIGVASIGWIQVGVDGGGEPATVHQAGIHTFDAGVEGDVESGRDEARGAARRMARMPRRMFDRRQRRRKKLLRLLQRSTLLPPGKIGTPQEIHEYLLALDAQLRGRFNPKKERVASHVLPYRLRAAALDGKLEPFELGRVFYHLAQRRGFLSNRKSLKKDEDEGVVQQGITELQTAMTTAGARTLGEYFAGLDPEEERIRRRWTARQMYVDEFNHVWDAQAPHHPAVLTDALRKESFRAIFFQRPLKSARRFIGRCELVPSARRAALADRLVQRFRILQKVNDLEITLPDESARRLLPQERARLIDALSNHGDLTFAKIKSKDVLGALASKPKALPKGTTFNFEQRDEEKKLPGHRTDEKMRSALGERWQKLTESERDAAVLEILSFQNPDALARRAMKVWGLDEQTARALAATRLEQGYAAHSRRALRQLVARMEDGTPYATARRELFPDSFEATKPVDRLPPVLKAVSSLRNPAVARALTELRKLVNEIIRVHGKPQQIRIELARDLKRGRKERERVSKNIDEQTKLRDQARARILKEAGLNVPRRPDVEKALLWEECGGTCPYTGRGIPFAALFGDNPQFDVEHILPFSRSLDNSFANKTLCYHEENREHKRNRTPFEAYSKAPDRYHEIIGRVRGFQGKVAAAKLRRFEMQEIPEDFVNRQLADTRYASRLAGDYLALLYGGRADASGTQRIQISTGGITFHLRNEWLLNSILGQGEKNRDDHRHHAVDALAVALASPGLVAKLQRAAERASDEGRRLFARVQEPWAGFLEQAREKVLAINVSRRQSKKIAGDLHEDTNYSKEYQWIGKDGKPKSVRHVRKPIEGMNEKQVDDIVDPVIREKVLAWLKENPKIKPNAPVQYPTINTRDGREIPIKTVRIRKVISAVPVGEGARKRYVKPGANHHSVIVAVLDKDGKETKWEDYPVTRLEVHKRKAAGQPIIQKDWGPGRRFKFSIAQGESFLINDDQGVPCLWRCTTVSDGDNWFRLNNDARTREALKEVGGRPLRASGNKLKQRGARKVMVTYLGEIVPAND